MTEQDPEAELVTLLVDVLLELDELSERIREALRDHKKPPEQPDGWFEEMPF